MAVLRETVKSSAEMGDRPSRWQEVTLGDRRVLFYLYVRRGTVFAALIDPARQSYPGLSPEERIFYTTPQNVPYQPQPFSEEVFAQAQGIAFSNEDNREYQLLSLPPHFHRGPGVPCHSGRAVFPNTYSHTNGSALPDGVPPFAIPMCWLVLRRLLLIPLTK